MAAAAAVAVAGTSTADQIEEESISKSESVRLKTLAEQTYNSSDLKLALRYAKRAHRLCPTLAGVSQMLTAFKILSAAATDNATTPHWYKILEVEPFSHINTIKKQYKKLALILHPDKNMFTASEEAFKLVSEAFRVLSDKIRRKEYDMKLRIALQSALEAGEECGGPATVDTFWTACSTCRLLHQFERKHLEHNLMCPNCKKTFMAVEAMDDKEVNSKALDDDREKTETRVTDRIRTRSDSKRKMSSVGEIMQRSEQLGKTERSKNEVISRNLRSGNDKEENTSRARGSVSLQKGKRVNDGDGDGDGEGEEMMTLAEMQRLAKQNVNKGKLKVKMKVNDKEKEKDEEQRSVTKSVNLKTKRRRAKGGNSMNERKSVNSENERSEEGKIQDLDSMAVEDSDFYDFDKGRVERSFKKGQVWALYDDDHGMPRHYGLIDEVVSTHPFEVEMIWLEPQNNGDEELITLEKIGFHISCGRFRVSRRTSLRSLNVFSHVVDCERAARDVYRIYPKKGSVWALYNEDDANRDKRRYTIVVFLTTYSEVHGLSMGYLEKVSGYKTIFKRQKIGFNAIKWLEKHNVRLFSHQIPARKLSKEDAPDLSGDCWELDPAALPLELLTTGTRK